MMDIAIAAILIAAALLGSRRGLFLSLAGVVILILALVGANLGAKALLSSTGGLGGAQTAGADCRTGWRRRCRKGRRSRRRNARRSCCRTRLKTRFGAHGTAGKTAGCPEPAGGGQTLPNTGSADGRGSGAGAGGELLVCAFVHRAVFVPLLLGLHLAAWGINLVSEAAAAPGRQRAGRRRCGTGGGSPGGVAAGAGLPRSWELSRPAEATYLLRFFYGHGQRKPVAGADQFIRLTAIGAGAGRYGGNYAANTLFQM